MKHAKYTKKRTTDAARRAAAPSMIGLSLLVAACTGCSAGSDSPSAGGDRFSPSTFDENQEPLTNAVIGTPTGVIHVDSTGVSSFTDGGMPAGDASAPLPVPDAGGGFPGDDAGFGDDAGSFPGDDGGFADGGFADGGPADGGGGGFGFWHFDDCSPQSNFLADSSGGGANAQHPLKGACVPGISNLGVEFRKAKDLVQVPDEPQFTVGSRVAVAAWVHPNQVSGDQPIVLKRLDGKTSFSLGVHKGNVEMSVVLDNGTTVISRAPLAAGTWSHVAGMFDGTFLFLFINGQQFGQVFAAGTLRDVFAPVRIGATTQSQFFDGIIDEVFVSTQAISKETLTALSCITRPATLSVNPKTSGPVPFDTTVHYDVSITNNDVGRCQAKFFDVFASSPDPGISVNVDLPFVQNLQPGAVAVVGANVTGSDGADPGVHQIPVTATSFFPNFETVTGQLTYDLEQPTGCFVSTNRELMITSTSVVDDPVRTFGVTSGGGNFGDGGIDQDASGLFDGGASGSTTGGGGSSGSGSGSVNGGGFGGTVTVDASSAPSAPPSNPDSLGIWTFGHLLRELAPTPADAPAMVEKLFQTWLTDQTVNGFTVTARPSMQQTLLDVWPRTSSGALDLDQSPLRLQAIVNRMDLRNLAAGSAGEGRLVFAVNGSGGFPLNFTVILEYNLPARSAQDVADWAQRWHALASLPFPSETYNAALEAITRRFAGRNAQPSGVNGSALINLRTNEQALSNIGRWELREFGLSPSTHLLQEVTVKETPDLGFNNTQRFADFVNQNASAVISEVPGAAGVVLNAFEGGAFMGGSVFNDLVTWSGPGIVNDEARFHASLNTCNGCHGPEVNTSFLQITPRSPGGVALLSPFLTGTTVTDQAGQTRTVNDLARRRTDLTNLVCGGGDGGPPSVEQDAGVPVGPADAGPSAGFDASLPFADGGFVVR